MPHDVIIIGSGPAGLTAAIYTSRAGLKTLVVVEFSPLIIYEAFYGHRNTSRTVLTFELFKLKLF